MPERSDAFMMYIIGILKGRGMLSVVWSEVGQDQRVYVGTTLLLLFSLQQLCWFKLCAFRILL